MIPKNILLIDDDDDELEIFNMALKTLPSEFHCRLVRTARAALEIAKQARTDFVFIDYNMPKINGLEALATLKKTNEFRDARFILYSNFMDESMIKNAIESGAYACIRKPDKTSTLAVKLRELLLKNISS